MTTDESENKPVFEEKSGLDKNITMPILVVAILTALAVWFVPSSEEEVDLKKPLPQLDSVIQPLDGEDSTLPPLDTGTAIRPLDEIEFGSDESSTESEDSSMDNETTASSDESSATSSESTEPANTSDDSDLDVRQLIAKLRKEGSGSNQRAFTEAEKRRRIGDNEDAYLLYFFAARRGHAESALRLGTMADPASFTTISSVLPAPDSAQAVKWYKKAIDAGNRDAKKKLEDLTRRIKKQAENGSSEAQRLLLQLL
jgi:hypothetical protein